MILWSVLLRSQGPEYGEEFKPTTHQSTMCILDISGLQAGCKFQLIQEKLVLILPV